MKFIAHVKTRLVGSEYTVEFEVDDEAQEAMSAEERESFLDEEAQQALVDVGAYEIWRTEVE